MKSLITLMLTTLLAGVALACETKQAYFNNLTQLCGQTFVGASTYPDDPEHDFAGKRLVAHFSACDDAQIRIKFSVGEDQSTAQTKGCCLNTITDMQTARPMT